MGIHVLPDHRLQSDRQCPLHTYSGKGNAIVLITADAPDQDRQYRTGNENDPAFWLLMKQLFCQQKEEPSLRLQSFRRESFWSEMPGEEQSAGIEPATVITDFQHTEHGKGEQKQVQTVCVTGPCQMRFEMENSWRIKRQWSAGMPDGCIFWQNNPVKMTVRK